MERRKVYAFDFDGTLTTRDTLLAFISFVAGRGRLWLALLRYSPLLLMMRLGLCSNEKSKQRVFAHFFAGMSVERFNALGRSFAATHRQLLRPEGMATLRQALADGAQVVVVSASIDNWVAPFFGPGVTVIGTQAEVADGVLTGRFLTPNCYGLEKTRRLRQLVPDLADCYLVAFGDSRGDRELLAAADEPHYKPFRTKTS